jgi:hypothetical protein
MTGKGPGLIAALCCCAFAAGPVSLLSADDRQVVFELALDSFEFVPTPEGMQVRAAGCYALAAAGEPDLPSRDVLVGIPPEGGVRVSATSVAAETRTGVSVRPIPRFSDRVRRTLDSPAPKPRSAVELLGIERFRDVRVARVRLNPARLDQTGSALVLDRRLRVTLAFDRARASTPNSRPEPALDRALSQMLVNGTQALGWKLAAPMPDSVNFFARSSVWLKVQTDTTGIYRITPADIAAAGFDPAEIDPAALRLYGLGRHVQNGPYGDTIPELAVYVSDNGDGRFTGSDFLAFYAPAPSDWRQPDSAWEVNPFTTQACYWLTWGGGSGRRMAEVSAAGAAEARSTGFRRVRLESDELCPARSGLLWLWQYFYKASGAAPTETGVVLALADRDTITRVSGRLYGRYNDDGTAQYPVMLYLNGVLLDTVTLSAQASTPPPCNFTFTSLAPAFAARPGLADTFGFKLYPDREEEVFLDYLEVDYVRKLALSGSAPQLDFSVRAAGDYELTGADRRTLVLDATDPAQPRRLTGGQASGSRLSLHLAPDSLPARIVCALPDRLRRPASIQQASPGALRAGNSADYYIICPDENYDAAQTLARYRENNIAGLPEAHVQAVRLSEVYNDYSFGWEEPGAIKAFLQAKRPQYVLLAGDGTYDYRNIQKLRTSTQLPPYETGFDIDPEVYGRTAKALDAWYADLDGTGSSPDLILGRATARTGIELRQFVDKVTRYEAQTPDFWAKRFILLSDDEYLGSVNERDPIGFQHIFGNENMASAATPLLDPVKVYLTEWPLGDRGQSANALRSELERGALLWCFYGHGAGFQLCHEKALEIARVRDITNGTRLPLAFFGSCGVGRFDDTRFEAIAEELVRYDQGCIATVGATKATESGGNEALAGILFPTLMSQPDMPIGPAFFAACQVNTLYHLFGDPATVLKMPRHGIAPGPIPDTFYPGRTVAVRCSVPTRSGTYSLSAREATWYRNYRSDNGQQIFYTLPGYEIARALGTFDTAIHTSFVVPRINYPDTTATGNGYYARTPNTSRISILAARPDTAWSSLVRTIPLSRDTAEKTDNTPPEVILYADGIRLSPEETVVTRVPARFELEGRASDPSGILLVPLTDLMLSLSFAGTKTDLTPYFSYDANSTTTGRFSYPVRLTRTRDSLTVVASDNAVDPSNPGPNRRTQTVRLRTSTDEELSLDTCLVYPNPTTGPAAFTFLLSRSAQVSVRVFTIGGQLVQSLPYRLCPFGFNSIEWDGTDQSGRPVPNGLYLYRITARARTASQTLTAGHTDKLIVYR